MSHHFAQAAVYFERVLGSEDIAKDEYGNPKLTLSVAAKYEEQFEKLDSGHNIYALVMSRAMSGDTTYRKYLVECAINLLAEVTVSMSPNVKKPYDDPRLSEHDIDIEMLNQLRLVAQTLEHMVNSASWQDGKYHSFDSMEIGKRLSNASTFK